MMETTGTYKSLDELTLMDDYMFGAVMQDSKLVKPLIEQILGMRIEKVTYIETQKSVENGFNVKGVRLDLYIEDENGIVYNVEIQTTRQRNLSRRMRYYQSAIDAHILKPGADYVELKDSYVIFICNHDPFGKGRYLYRFENRCVDDLGLNFGDGAFKVVVNTRGHVGSIAAGLQEILSYLNDGSVSGSYSRELKNAVQCIKANEERRHEYMNLMLHEQELRDRYMAQGMAQGVTQGKDQSEFNMIRNLMKSMKITAQEAMNLLMIPAEDQKKYFVRLGNSSSMTVQ